MNDELRNVISIAEDVSNEGDKSVQNELLY